MIKLLRVLILCALLSFPFITNACIPFQNEGSGGWKCDPNEAMSVQFTSPPVSTPVTVTTPMTQTSPITVITPIPSIPVATIISPVKTSLSTTSMPTMFSISLKYGSTGNAVKQLQDFLIDQGFFKNKIDGRFGLGTRKAVISFQIANGLKGDGYFGKTSRDKANIILADILKASTDAEKADN